MSSESEFERLYQEFIAKGGGSLTGSNTPGSLNSFLQSLGETVNTPASYYDETNSVNLSPSKLAELNAAEEQFNRKQALSIISGELAENNFSNPYASLAQTGIADFTEYLASPGFSSLSTTNDAFNLLSNASNGGTSLAKSQIVSGVLSETGINFDKILQGSALGASAVSMFNSLSTHTAQQVLDLPQTLQDADTLSGLNKSFGEQDNSCSLFNELMGIMSGSFDSAFSLLSGAKDSLLGILNQTGIQSFLDTISNDISNIVSGLVGPITDNINSLIGSISGIVDGAIANIVGSLPDIKGMLGNLGDMASNAFNAVSSVTNQILGEVSKIANMATQISDKLASIAMASAMLDPCKLAVLMNTGSPELKNAASLLNAPLPSGLPDFNIPTIPDPRAFAGEVDGLLNDAKSLASSVPGVPQSPFSAAASIYQPVDSYLFDLNKDVPLNDVIENATQSTDQIKLPDMNIVPSINDLTGIIPGGLQNISNIIPGSISDLSGIALSVDGLSRSNSLSPQLSTAASSADVVNTSSKNPMLDNKKKTLSLLPVRAQVEKTQWRIEIAQQIQTQQGLIRTTINDMRKYTESSTTLFQSGQKRQVIILQEELAGYKKTLRGLYKIREEFVYQSPGGDINSAKEEQARLYYVNEVKVPQQKVINNIIPKIANIIKTWQSIKDQSILGPR